MGKKNTISKGDTKGKNKGDDGKPEKKSRRSFGKAKARLVNVADDDYEFRNSLESDRLTIVNMAADGNCLFRALADQLYGDYGSCHEEIRSDICDFMEENKEDFTVFLVLDDDSCEEGDDGKDFESYIETMRMDGVWGGNLELVAAARLYQRKITVFSNPLSAYSIEPGKDKTSGPDLLVSFHDNDHYNSVRDEKSSPQPPLKWNKKTRKLDRQSLHKDLSQGSDTTSTTTTRASSVSNSNVSTASQKLSHLESKQTHKPTKKGTPCPCGSGQRYKKCCRAKEKHAARLGKSTVTSPQEECGEEVAMRGNFLVLQI